ncbi:MULTISPECIES: LamG-like jellyroll fold domain-containing protein [Emticicia]|uniref:LamG-like jellyroll fold domain-containing protein n=1 Tax=Emticicia TaxID=312278 RepID=UPI0007D89B36|nr:MULTISPECIES: LamG-like jellyroll fold domain-containing protein [Emticicia]
MKKALYIIYFLACIKTFGQVSLPTPTGLTATIEPNNRFTMKWNCDISGAFSALNTTEYVWFEIEIDNGTNQTIHNSSYFFVSNPANSYEFKSPFYLKPNTQYYFRVRAKYTANTATDVSISSSNWSNISNSVITSTPPEYGITVLTHGFQLMGKLGMNSDFEKHARKIYNRLGGEATVLTNDGITGEWKIMRGTNGQLLGNGDRTKELIFFYDWASASNGTATFSENGELEAAADRLFSMLTEVKVMNPTTGIVEIWYQNAELMAKKSHFIGHSRGVGMLLQTIHRFGKYFPTVKIDHFTSLDPHPASKYGDVKFDTSDKPSIISGESPLASLPGVYSTTTNGMPNNCYTEIPWKDAVTGGYVGVGGVLWSIIENEAIRPLCQNGPVKIKFPENVIRAENYYREDGKYEEIFWVDENLKKAKQVIDDILAIYDVVNIDPNPGKQKSGFDKSQIGSIRTSLQRDLETLKRVGNYDFNYVLWGGLQQFEVDRLKNIFDKLSTLKGGANGAISLLSTDIPTLVDNIINLEVDRIIKIAPFDGVLADGLGEWNFRLNNSLVSSGFSAPDYTTNIKLNEAIGTLAGGAHSGVHHWYFGTVDPVNSRIGNDWYSAANNFASGKNVENLGFYNSRLGKHLNDINQYFPKMTIAEMDARILERQSNWGMNPIFNGSFHYGEVAWFGNHYLNKPHVKTEKRFPIFLGKNQPANEFIYSISKNLKTYFYPKTKLRHQMFLVPSNHNYLKFKIDGIQSASFGVSVSFEYRGTNNETVSVILANDVITHVAGTSKIFYMDIPASVKGRVCWMTVNFEYRSSQNYSNPDMVTSLDMITGIYIDDFDMSINTSLPIANKLNISNGTFCSNPYYYGKSNIDIENVWDKRTTQLANSEGFVNWWNLSRADESLAINSFNFKNYRNENITWGEACEAVYLAAKKLGFTNFQEICSNEKNQQAQITKFLFDSRLITQNTPSDKIFIGDFYKLVYSVILDQGAAYPYKTFNRPNSNITYKALSPSFVNTAITTAGIVFDINGKPFLAWLTDGFKNGDIWGTELVSRMSLSKTVTLAYFFKKAVTSGAPNGRLANTIESLPNVTDYKSLGAKYELYDDINDEIPTSVVVGKTEFYQSGQNITFSFPRDTLADGTKVHFYWAINGISKSGNLTAISSNLQSVQYTVPTVTERTTFELYIYLGAENGNSAEMTKEIVVSPSGFNNNLVVGEYYIDTDPGIGNATTIFQNYLKVGIDSSFNVETSSMTLGLHTLSIRVKDKNNNWSAVKTSQFEVTNPCGSTQSASILGNSEIRLGEKTFITLNFVGQSPFNYVLSNGLSGSTNDNQVLLEVSPSANTTYTITSATNICGEVTKSGQAQVNVYNCDFPSGFISGSSSIYSGETVNLNLSFYGTPPFQYTLNNGTSGTAVTNSISIPVSPQSDSFYYLTDLTNTCGSGLVNGMVQVLVKPCILPTASITNATYEVNDYNSGNIITRVNFTGTKPISFQMSKLYNSTTSSDFINIQENFFSKQNYTVKSVSNRCGVGTTSGVVVINYNDCPTNINNPNGITSLSNGTNFRKGHYASDKISGANNVSDLTSFFAAKSIELKPGFSAGSNEVFQAEIKNCISPTTNGLIANYRFYSLNDYSGNDNTGIGSVTYGNNRFGNSTLGSIQVSKFKAISSESLNLNTDLTFSVWVKPISTTGLGNAYTSEAGGVQYLFSRLSNCTLGQISGIALGVRQLTNSTNIVLNRNGVFAEIPINNKIILNKWTHIVVCLSKPTNSSFTIFNVFVDGVKYNLGFGLPLVDLSIFNNQDILFGSFSSTCNNSSSLTFLDDIRLYNRLLLDNEIKQIYDVEKP